MILDSKHINSAFDEDLDRLLTQLMTMGGLVENAIRESSRALINLDTELAESVIKDDHRIDLIQEDIDMAAVNCIALRQPQARDLRMIIAVMRISNALERCADHAKNTAKRTSAIVEAPPLTETIASLGRFSKLVQALIKDSLDCFIQADESKARDVIARDHEIDQIHSGLFREYLTYMLEKPSIITSTMHLMFIAKNIERISDHATAIAEQAVYMMTGHLPEDERPKNDDAAYVASADQD